MDWRVGCSGTSNSCWADLLGDAKMDTGGNGGGGWFGGTKKCKLYGWIKLCNYQTRLHSQIRSFAGSHCFEMTEFYSRKLLAWIFGVR
jgi:hypothetical protein